MTVFEKITGFAIKAKDNALSKAILSKDKRLEQSMSENIQAEDIFLKQMSTYGLPSAINLVAFDCVSGLLAVAGGSKYIKFFGKGISTTIMLPSATEIKYMQFKTGFPLLLVIDKSNTIITIDLQTQKIRSVTAAAAIITSQAYCAGTDWLFIGYVNGFVDVYDIFLGTVTQYQIPDLLPEEEKSHVIVDLQLHPTDLNLLLIGYESVVHIWDIRERVIKKSYSLRRLDTEHRNGNLTCLAWSPNGSRFMGGYDDGYTHLWDINNEKRPMASRKLFQHYTSSSEIEPIYQIAWFTNELDKKSFVILAGGAHRADTLGLNLLEFDYEGEAKEPKKQTIMPLSFDLSHFLILSTDPYHGGMKNPFGIAVVGADHSIRLFGLEHGFPSLRLPPALDFLGPHVVNACYLSRLPDPAYQLLSAVVSSDRRTRYAPLTGGIAGHEHVYRIESNDLLLTIHQDETIRFWDASYTALRPLSHLAINTLSDLNTHEAIVCCLDINKTNGTLAIGFSQGQILIYEYYPEKQEDPVARQEQVIDQCDTTLKEIADLLEDMGTDEEEAKSTDDSKNPFLVSETQHEQPHDLENAEAPSLPLQKNQDPLKEEEQKKDTSSQLQIFSKLESRDQECGYHAILKISLGSTIRSVISIGEYLVAAALDDGRVVLLDVHRHVVLFSENIAEWDNEHSVPPVPIKDNSSPCEPQVEQKKKVSISFIGFFNTYSSSKVMKATPQLFICLSNGHVYQFSVLFLLSGVSVDNLATHLCIHTSNALSNIRIIDMKGEPQLAISENIEEEDENESRRTDLQKENSHHSLLSDHTEEPVLSPATISITSNNSSGVSFTSKRMAALGKPEYRQQDNPHFIICTSSNSVSVYLSGFNVKLFSKEFKEVSIVQSEIVKKHDKGTVLYLLFDNGKLSCYSLPKIEPMFELNLPEESLLNRLSEASLSQDGRIVLWTGQYEMKQYQFMANPNIQSGESVILYDPHKQLPPHPSSGLKRQKSVTKKSWLNAVAEAFQKEPLTVRELDSIMGRVTAEESYAATKKKIETYKAKNEQSKSSGPGGVFAELGNKMNERGERLNELNQKFTEMNAASGDFLKSIKDYNERQARKKWWEF